MVERDPVAASMALDRAATPRHVAVSMARDAAHEELQDAYLRCFDDRAVLSGEVARLTHVLEAARSYKRVSDRFGASQVRSPLHHAERALFAAIEAYDTTSADVGRRAERG